MKNLLQHYWQSYWRWVVGLYLEPFHSQQTWFLSKKKSRGLKMKFRTLKLLRRRRIARKKIRTTEKGIQALIIGLALVLILLVGCSYKMVPSETKIEYGTTETDSKNNKLQQKQSITQSWKWQKQ